jgi:uncharacterized protein YkwD
MGEPGDRGDVARTFSTIAVALLLSSLALAPSAAGAVALQNGKAIGQQGGETMERPARAASVSPLIAPLAACPNQTSLATPVPEQEQAMRCMTDFARLRLGLTSLSEAEALDASARGKTLDILRCDSFSHFACDRDFTYWMQETGYISGGCWRAGENLAWGLGEQGTVRSIFRAWMRSPGHRRNILGDYRQLGVGVEVGTLAGQPGTYVWTQHFGTHCDAPAQA